MCGTWGLRGGAWGARVGVGKVATDGPGWLGEGLEWPAHLIFLWTRLDWCEAEVKLGLRLLLAMICSAAIGLHSFFDRLVRVREVIVEVN